jgi:GT2 family glycosyltransferase/glycosyltransferase involved in cell wall biosynthesis
MNLRYSDISDFISKDIHPKDILIVGQKFLGLLEHLQDEGFLVYGGVFEGLGIEKTFRQSIENPLHFKAHEPLPQDFDLIILEHFLQSNSELFPHLIEIVTKHTQVILISSAVDESGPETLELKPLSGWTHLLSDAGFYRDFVVGFDQNMIGLAVYRRVDGPVSNILAHYETVIAKVQEEVFHRREQTQELRRELFTKDQVILGRSDFIEEKLRLIEELNDEIKGYSEKTSDLETSLSILETKINELTDDHEQAQRSWEREKEQLNWKIASIGEELEIARAEKRAFKHFWDDVQLGIGWKFLHRARIARLRLAPPGSTRDRVLQRVLERMRNFRRGRDVSTVSSIHVSETPRDAGQLFRSEGVDASSVVEIIPVRPLDQPPEFKLHLARVDIIICIHNAIEDVRRCLESVLENTSSPYHLVLVDDGSEIETKAFLETFASEHPVTLIRNEKSGGYTRAANQGLRKSEAEYALLLNSDTVVTEGWVDRMIAVAESEEKIGLVGPLSNTASWQSIPEIEKDGDWAPNPLPGNISISEMGRLVDRYSPRLWPKMPLLNGFCLLLKRSLIEQVGYFDEEQFGDGYGEEDDYVLRARKAGWDCALADDVYVYHSQSQSYSSERRKEQYEIAGKNLVEKHGDAIVQDGVEYCLNDRVLDGIRARSRVIFPRHELIELGGSLFRGKRVLFILPIAYPGGGGNVVTLEGQAMMEMGVEVGIFNLNEYRERFERIYPDLPFRVHYGEIEDLASVSKNYDAVVATYNPSVDWMNRIERTGVKPALGYYIQGFEPYMYEVGSPEYEVAKASYGAVGNLVRFTKTRWTRQEVLDHTGLDSEVVGVSVDLDLFRSRPTSVKRWPEAPLRVCAMVRPASPYRSPRMTMKLLRKAKELFSSSVEVILFGSTPDDPEFTEISEGYPWNLAGVLDKSQMAQLLNQVDVFVDFSQHQAMGLTALEAMACGAAVIVPSNGGAVTFARHGSNSIIVDTSYEEACWKALYDLIDNDERREMIRKRAVHDVSYYFPERPAFQILKTLFHEESS